MDLNSINLMLSWFSSYTEEEKEALRFSILSRDAILMSALSNFLQTKSISLLDQDFRQFLNFRTVPEFVTAPAPTSSLLKTSSSSLKKDSAVSPKKVIYDFDAKKEDAELTKDGKRKISLKSKRMEEVSQQIMEKKREKKSQILEIDFSFLSDYEKIKKLTPQMKKQLFKVSETIEFDDFLDLRHLLGFEKVNITSFMANLFEKFEQFLKENPDASCSVEKGLSIETFVNLLCGNAETPMEKIGYLGVFFYFLDFNMDGYLDQDEVFQGLVMLSTGDEREKIKAGFEIFGESTVHDEKKVPLLIMSSSQLTRFLEIIMKVAFLKESKENDDLDLYEIQLRLNRDAFCLSKMIFKIIDTTKYNSISLEQFLLFYGNYKEEKGKLDFLNDPDFKSSLATAEMMSIQRITFLKFDDKDLQREKIEKIYLNLKKQGRDGNLKFLFDELRFGEIRVDTLVKAFKELKVRPAMTVVDFKNYLNKVYDDEKIYIDESVKKKYTMKLFQLFDLNNNNVLEWNEVMSALIFLSNGSEKVKSIELYNIYDEDQDKTLEFIELYHILRGIFNLLLFDAAGNDNLNLGKQNAETLAFSTAVKCFEEQKLDPKDAKQGLNLDAFIQWYQSLIENVRV